MNSPAQTTLLGREEQLTFKGNLKQARYGWLRLTPAYSVHLVADLLDQFTAERSVVLDPYCGTGTTALVCAEKGLESVTTDINPFLIWLARAKTAEYSADVVQAFTAAAAVVENVIETHSKHVEWVPALHQIEKWWDEPTLHALGRAMAAIREWDDDGGASAVGDLLRLAFCRTLIERASVSFGHQSMSFRKRREQEVLLPTDDLISLVGGSWTRAVETLAQSARSPIECPAKVALADARELTTAIAPNTIDVVVTSPPYPNRMSYIRELRPYMYWLGFLSDGRAAGELDWQAIGGTWGCATSNVGKWTPPCGSVVPFGGFDKVIGEIAARSDLLSRYVHKYFVDMVDHVSSLRTVLAPDATVHYIVGNSKFYDVLVPVQDIYAGMFESVGLTDSKVEVIRKRSSKRELYEYVVSARNPR